MIKIYIFLIKILFKKEKLIKNKQKNLTFYKFFKHVLINYVSQINIYRV